MGEREGMTMLGATAAEWQASLELARLAAGHAMLILTPVLLGGLWLLLAAAIRPARRKRTIRRHNAHRVEADPVADAIQSARLAARALGTNGSVKVRY